ncbi:MAG: DUF4395 domain-containing protein [Campylobacterales bacterium]|nr:DUF4395 domain-containing protein [Campylobacterales bacterium]
MGKYIYFGEEVKGYEIPVINEREARAAAGLLFLFALPSFMYSYLFHDFRFTKIFVTFFMIDFFIRILINPKYAPSIIAGRFFVSAQKPEYIGAAQKRWAWSIGLALAVIMFLLIVVFSIMTPIKIVICITCLILLFSESVFGICLGCKLYTFLSHNNPRYCPGDVCEIRHKEAIQKIDKIQWLILIIAITLSSLLTYNASNHTISDKVEMKCESGKCNM